MSHPEAEPSAPEPGGLGRVMVRVAMAAAVLLALLWLGRELGAFVPRFEAWVRGLGIWGPVVFVGGYALGVVAFAPGSLLTLAAGAIFGLVQGTLLAFLAATCGAALAFLVARYAARSAIERRLAANARWGAIDRAIAERGRWIVFLLRLSPAFPFNLLNYGLGLTGVRFVDYVVACLGMLPGTLLYVYYGKVGRDVIVATGGGMQRDAGYWVVLGLGLAATVAVTVLVTRTARRALREATDAAA